MRVILLLLLLTGCWQPEPHEIVPLTCGQPCTTSGQCSEIFSGCRVCFGGRCTTTLPADPISDAGTVPSDGQKR